MTKHSTNHAHLDFDHLNNSIPNHPNQSCPTPHPRNLSQVAISRAENCLKEPLRPNLWEELRMNDYIHHYPRGNKLDLEHYAITVGVSDFVCGIGQVCNAHQLCERVKGRDWYALVAAQNWNTFMNEIYQAVSDLIDFEPDSSRRVRQYAAYVGLSASWISSFPTSLFSSYGPLPNSIWVSRGSLAWFSLSTIGFHMSAINWIVICLFIGYGVDRWTRTADLHWILGQTQDIVEGLLSNITNQIISEPISSDQGLAGINPNGMFLTEVNPVSKINLQREYGQALKSKTLCKLWRIQNAFIARGNEPCNGQGPNGASDDLTRISYCGSDNIIMNVFRAEKDGTHHFTNLKNAPYVENVYGISVSEITLTSWNCQQKYGVFEFEPFLNR
ncbi:hypothetical protein CROQUDRAFT_47095 [Cronartium quercuum f. sp. fusiforme G11]|uniref:DUF7872 domain-containing protein n=1 Tax=Cronartium quercuum f. sp. fusiforme G11 TaxID=708437 RepID=A0A9P6T9X3_9BASI|nr:hypothetical protein CROQUDRAFT_47095 [Cronartium quercuum f. sp. fusiforme G11]